MRLDQSFVLLLWQVHLYSLANLAYRGRILLTGEAATGLAFSPDGDQLAVATAGKEVHVYNVASRLPAAWMTANGKALQVHIISFEINIMSSNLYRILIGSRHAQLFIRSGNISRVV